MNRKDFLAKLGAGTAGMATLSAIPAGLKTTNQGAAGIPATIPGFPITVMMMMRPGEGSKKLNERTEWHSAFRAV
jgi:hypothetical protein